MSGLDETARTIGRIEAHLESIAEDVRGVIDDLKAHAAQDDQRFTGVLQALVEVKASIERADARLGSVDGVLGARAASGMSVDGTQQPALPPRDREPSYPSIPVAPTTGPHPLVEAEPAPAAEAPAIKSNVRGFSFTLTRRDLYVVLAMLIIGGLVLAYSPIAHDLVAAYRERGRAEMMPAPVRHAPAAPSGDHP